MIKKILHKHKGKTAILFSFALLIIGGFYTYSVHADSGQCPVGQSCGQGVVAAEGLAAIGNGTASVTVSISADGGLSKSESIIFQGSGCTDTAAHLTVDGGSSTTTYPGQSLNYVWYATCADTYTSTYSGICIPASNSTTGSWIANTVSGSSAATVASSQVNCTYTITYTAKKTSTNTTRSASVTVNVLSAPPAQQLQGSWQTGAWSPCVSGNRTRTVSCVDQNGQTATNCNQSTKPDTSETCTQPVSGSCGSGTRADTLSAPTDPNLCANGSIVASSPQIVGSNYQWSCGVYNSPASSVTCTAEYSGPVSGACGQTQNTGAGYVPQLGWDPLCSSGTASGLSTNPDGSSSWTCLGSGTPPGGNATCHNQPPEVVDGQCGTAVNTNAPTVPTTQLCYSGNPSAVTATTYNRSQWTCSGYSGGSSATCRNQVATDADYTLSVTPINKAASNGYVIAYPGDVVTFRVKTIPSSFPGSLATGNFTIRNAFTPREGDVTDGPNEDNIWYPSLSGKDVMYHYDFGDVGAADYGQIGTFSPTALSASNTYTSVLSVPIPSISGWHTGFYSYTIYTTAPWGIIKTAPLRFYVIAGANPIPKYTLTVVKTIGGSVTSDDGGIACGISCAKQYEKDTVVTLTAVPDSANWKFLGWSGNCSGTNTTCAVTMSASKTVSARFIPKPVEYQEF